MLILDHLKAFLNFLLLGLILLFEMENHCPVFCLGWMSKEIFSEEFPFENINNLTTGMGLKIFNGEFTQNK